MSKQIGQTWRIPNYARFDSNSLTPISEKNNC